MDGVIRCLPAPNETPPIICAREPEFNRRNSTDDAPFAGLAFKIVADRHMGKLTYLRVYSGSLRAGETVLNSTRDVSQRVARIFRMHANQAEPSASAYCGYIVAVVGLTETRTGDTLCHLDHPIHLDAIEFPSPVISVSIAPASRGDSERLSEALHCLADEDPTFTVTSDDETREAIVSGMGELHLEIITDRLRCGVNVAATVSPPEVAYRETGTIAVEGSYKHVKQTGGRGQYAHVVLRLEPTNPGTGFEFVNQVTGGRIPAAYIPVVEKGVVTVMRAGPYAGYPVVDMRVIPLDGSYQKWIPATMHFKKPAVSRSLSCS